MPESGSVELVWLFGPFAVYLVMLGVYYVWEGKREKKIRNRYEETNHGQ
ncbi:hypothetical protein [Halostagnicola kamekurae]|uniref:Uncharacterized protein n=1 Tax=Halostagnicola kamekurae TaxID=619731 RepID=A0A1I6RR57_9EURY|nr:hypothetical protein [Halostagnicola kamekurae]SFS67090.1 hypothetical protein SAMN04488556_2007 [Halostagnicola kamekurae]